jgi:hypothetical protein
VKLVAFLGLFFLAQSVLAEEGAVPDTVAFEVGQRWSYDTRPEDPGSTLVIGKIEDLPKLGVVVHISIFDLNIKNSRAPSGFTHVLGHMPMGADALRTSVTSLAGSGEPAEQFDEGYAMWKEASGGAFSIAVRDAVAHVESTIASPE